MSQALASHQYIDRASGELREERFYLDPVVLFFYNRVREQMPAVFNWLISRRATQALGLLQYDRPWSAQASRRFLTEHGIDLAECVEDPAGFTTARQVFERKIRYVERRPMSQDTSAIVAPADARVLLGSFSGGSVLSLKGKLFDREELFGDRGSWASRFVGGDYAIFRLTPDKYHYNHAPVSGRIVDLYEIDGLYHSCNPGAAMTVASPCSKNRRVVTIIDTDVPGGTQAGLVAMIEVVALMIGEIVQCYSERGYDDPQPIVPGMTIARGQPKSLFRPGSSTTVLAFEPGRIRFSPDLIVNQQRPNALSRYTLALGASHTETDVEVRSLIGHAHPRATGGRHE